MVVTQLAEQSLLIPEVHGSKPVISIIDTVDCWKDENKRKRGPNDLDIKATKYHENC